MKKFLSVISLLTSACVSAPPRAPVITPPTAPTYIVDVRVYEGAIDESPAGHKAAGATVTIANRTATTDGAGNVAVDELAGGTYEVCAEQPQWKRVCVTATVPDTRDIRISLERDVAPVQALRADGKIFRTADGQPWRWKGVSAFALLDRFAKGEDIADVLTAYRGYNLLRVWLYTPVKEWGARAWNIPPPETVVAFVQRVGRDGWYVELTLLTDDDPARIGQARRVMAGLIDAQPILPNLLIEIGNEPKVHKNIDTRALQATLDGSGFLYASGDASAEAFGSYVTAHTARTPDFARRAHDLLEYWTGGGPDAPTDPPHKKPAVADEPGKVQDVGGDAAAWRAYFGGCALFGAGATFHSETGKFGLPPTPDEARLAAVALEALNTFPADAPLGAYRRIVEPGQPDTGRTYVIGPYMVRSQQPGAAAPEPGWTPIDGAGVLWKR